MDIPKAQQAIARAQALTAELTTELATAAAALTDTPPAHGTYTAVTDRLVRPRPAPPTLGPAGYRFTDPTFGTALLRVTDENTARGQSCRVPSNSHIAAWNSDSSKFYVVEAAGAARFFSFIEGNPSLLPDETRGYIEPAFSYDNPDLVYCGGGANGRTIYTYNFSSHATNLVCDLDATYPELCLTGYLGGLETTHHDVWVTAFGGESQDRHVYVHHSHAGLLDVREIGFHIHAISLDRSGRYVLVYPTGADIQAGHAQVQIWDTQSGTRALRAITKLPGRLDPVTNMPGGHDTVGFGVWINQDCCTRTTWDGMQWQIRRLDTPDQTEDLIVPTLEPQEIYISDHQSWRHVTEGNAEPFLSSVYRRSVAGQPDAPWRAWDDEIIAVTPDGNGVVYRFCHHQSDAEGEFWAQPIANISPDGRWAIFTSNWGRSLAPNLRAGDPRQDVFLVHLT